MIFRFLCVWLFSSPDVSTPPLLTPLSNVQFTSRVYVPFIQVETVNARYIFSHSANYIPLSFRLSRTRASGRAPILRTERRETVLMASLHFFSVTRQLSDVSIHSRYTVLKVVCIQRYTYWLATKVLCTVHEDAHARIPLCVRRESLLVNGGIKLRTSSYPSSPSRGDLFSFRLFFLSFFISQVLLINITRFIILR